MALEFISHGDFYLGHPLREFLKEKCIRDIWIDRMQAYISYLPLQY